MTASLNSRPCGTKLSGCIGCGCLSLDSCALFNPNDRAAGAGPGAHYLFSDAPDPDPALEATLGIGRS